jgi:hypothetical protein
VRTLPRKFPLQVRSVPAAETPREVRTPCGLFRESTHTTRESGPSPYVLQAGGHRLAPLAALGRRSGDPGRLHCCNLLSFSWL